MWLWDAYGTLNKKKQIQRNFVSFELYVYSFPCVAVSESFWPRFFVPSSYIKCGCPIFDFERKSTVKPHTDENKIYDLWNFSREILLHTTFVRGETEYVLQQMFPVVGHGIGHDSISNKTRKLSIVRRN